MISTNWLVNLTKQEISVTNSGSGATSAYIDLAHIKPIQHNPNNPLPVYLPPLLGVERALGRICREVTIDSQEDRDRKDIRREVRLTFEDGCVLRLYHPQDCREDVWLDDVVGDVGDLVGHPLVLAEHADSPAGPALEWHFYRFATVKGYVTFSFRGEDEGFYSKEVIAEWYPPTGGKNV